MPVSPTYPGLYVEEIPSGVHPIIGASTADTAFVDYFPRGPVGVPVRVTSFEEFTQRFGGLSALSEASYAVLQYYLNGGQNAWIVRVDLGGPDAATVTLDNPAGAVLVVTAVDPGVWGESIRVAATETVPSEDGRFNVLVQETRTDAGVVSVVATEAYLGLSVDAGDARFAPSVINAGSRLITVALDDDADGNPPALEKPDSAGNVPAAEYVPLAGGDDGTAAGTDGELVTTGLATALEAGWKTLDKIDPYAVNLLCLPSSTLLDNTGQAALIAAAETYCEQHRAFLLVDPPAVTDVEDVETWLTAVNRVPSTNAALYAPRLTMAAPLANGRARTIGPSGTIAGLYARIDAARGVWKAPAGIDAVIRGAAPTDTFNDADSGALNPQGVNVLRTFPVFGPVVWGARTLFGADQRASEWKYVPVRRTALFVESSLVRGLQWVVFEPNDEQLWSQIRLNAGAFMQDLFLRGAFQGTTPRAAYLVRCDRTTTTPADVDRGVVNILVGFAPLKPAEFVIIRIQQLAGQAQA